MARLNLPIADYVRAYGPHVSDSPVKGWEHKPTVEKLVKTHCCFCGMQCGIQLQVAGNQVVGFEPWEEFPFNEGRLCPKGVKRYLQTHHPDRLTSPLIRTKAGFREASWDEALDLVVTKVLEIQGKQGKNAFAMMSGVSLSNEKSYLVGKFARLALNTANLDYNGRFCMVSAGAGNKKAFGIDRAANSWSDLPEAEVILVAGSNVSECFPTLMHYIWQARDRGARLIVVDPRITPIGRTADLHLAVRPGTDSALNQALLSELIVHGWIDETFVRTRCSGWDELAASVAECTPAWAEPITGVPAEQIRSVARMWGQAKTSFLLHARGVEQHTKGTDNVLSLINLVLATGRLGRKGCGYGTITGQGNGQGGREHGHKCDQLPGNRDIENPVHRAHVCKVWGVSDEELPHKGKTAVEIFEAIHAGEIGGLINICCNPMVSHPDVNFARAALERLPFLCVIDFFMSETARYADVVLPGSLQEEEEGTTTTAEARVVRVRAAVSPPGNARTDTWILLELARRLGRADKFSYADNQDIFDELRRASSGGTADYTGITWERVEREMGVFWPCPSEGHPGTPRLFEDQRSYHADGLFHLHTTAYRPSAEIPDAEYPIYLTSGRSVFHYLSGTQTRRIKFLVDKAPGPLCEMHPELAAELGLVDRQLVTVETRRGALTVPLAVLESIPPRHRLRALPLAGGARRQPADRARARSGQQDARVQGRGLPGARRHRRRGDPRPRAVRRAAPRGARRRRARAPPGHTMMGPFLEFYVDPQRCIGCKACEAACSECDTHRGTAMIHVDFIDPGVSPQTAATVCMHCENPTCASVCPADAIKVDEHGIVQSSLKPRCIACNNCELACPFGVPKISIGLAQMQKCDMCFDRTSVGTRPMCATVCPTGALFYGTPEALRARRPQGHAINLWRFGVQEIRTRVRVMVPEGVDVLEVDVAEVIEPDGAAPPPAASECAREFL